MIRSSLLLFAAVALVACGETASRPTPVVLIVVDTLRKDHLSCYGYERGTSPEIDRLAADSLRYENAQAHASWTTPSIGALFTSQYPTTLGIDDERSVLAEDWTLLPEVLGAEGYRCGAVVSHSFCSSKWGFGQGFQSFDESNVLGHDAITSAGVSDRALEFLAENGDEPFFLWLHYFDAHFAYNGHNEFNFREPGAVYEGPVDDGMPFSQLVKLREQLEPADVQEIRDLYDSEIAYTDRQIGRVLDELRARGLYEESLIIFTADHGEEFLDHGRLGHAKTVYEELINVPLLVKLPGESGAVLEQRVGLVDVYPTVLEQLDIAPRSELEGRPLPRGEGPAGDELPPVFLETGRGRKAIKAVSNQRYKLIRRGKKRFEEFYDLEADPLEQKNLIGTAGAQVPELGELREALEAWVQRTEAAAKHGTAVELSNEELERLKALGYANDE